MTRQRSRGATSASTSCSRAPASSPTPRRRGPTSPPAPRRSSSARPRRARTSRSSSGSTRTSTTRRATTSSPTPRARRTASPRSPRSSTTSSAIEKGLMTTIHSYTNDQRILDVAHKDSAPRPRGRPEHHPDDDRRGQGARAGHPGAQGQVRRLRLRVPTPDGQRRRPHRAGRAVTRASRSSTPRSDAAAAGPMKGILGVSDEPLVSMDFKGDERSSIVDSASTHGPGRNLVKVIAWYDNEWGYAAASRTSSRTWRPACPSPPDRKARSQHGQADRPRRRRRGPARVRPRRLQRAARGRQGHRRFAHPRGHPDDRAPAQCRARGSCSRAISADPTARSPTASGSGRSACA